MTSLSPVLHRNGFFAPATWAADNASDLDLGSTEPVIAAGDPNSALTVGKRGVGYLLSTAHLGGIGGQLASRTICRGPLAARPTSRRSPTSPAKAGAWRPST